jgi:hypothetical protein
MTQLQNLLSSFTRKGSLVRIQYRPYGSTPVQDQIERTLSPVLPQFLSRAHCLLLQIQPLDHWELVLMLPSGIVVLQKKTSPISVNLVPNKLALAKSVPCIITATNRASWRLALVKLASSRLAHSRLALLRSAPVKLALHRPSISSSKTYPLNN